MKNLLNLSLQFHFIPPSFLHFHGYYPKSNSYSLCLGNYHMLSTSFFLYVALRPEDILSLRTYSGSQLPTGIFQLISQALKLSVIWPQTSFPRLLPLCVVLWNWSSCSAILRHDYVSFCYQNSCLCWHFYHCPHPVHHRRLEFCLFHKTLTLRAKSNSFLLWSITFYSNHFLNISQKILNPSVSVHFLVKWE